jgi:hypothetical protein
LLSFGPDAGLSIARWRPSSLSQAFISRLGVASAAHIRRVKEEALASSSSSCNQATNLRLHRRVGAVRPQQGGLTQTSLRFLIAARQNHYPTSDRVWRQCSHTNTHRTRCANGGSTRGATPWPCGSEHPGPHPQDRTYQRLQQGQALLAYCPFEQGVLRPQDYPAALHLISTRMHVGSRVPEVIRVETWSVATYMVWRVG